MVSKTARFKNHLFDTAITALLAIPISFAFNQKSGQEFLMLLMIIQLIYYSVFEWIFGRTIGKGLTQTKVVDANNIRPGFMRIFGRSICRAIPFNFVPIFINGKCLHDIISNTKVVYDK